MSNRNYIDGSLLLCGENEHGKYPVTFYIDKIVSAEGGSSVCYSAHHDNSMIGVLKEFYPLNVHSLMRNKDGQLICDPSKPDENERFDKLMEEYLEPYKKLMDLKSKDLATFIPSFEIFYGCNEALDTIGTVYIWTLEPERTTFESICSEIRKHPTVEPEYNLLRVLYSIESLVKCTCALHNAGFIHRDIKPSNFGFFTLDKEILTQTISFFDVDTICSVYNIPTDFTKGTNGYTEPEFGEKTANNQTDIFSIGATLFSAVIVSFSAELDGYRYKQLDYDDIPYLVDNSELITASDINSHPRVRSLLTQILQKTLCKRENRYKSCEDLLDDIQKVLYYLIPAGVVNDENNYGERWVLADVNKVKALGVNYERNSTLAMQYHLYTYPLYMDCPADKNNLNALVIGCGKYAQKFLDLALQIAQIPGKRLNVTVVASDADDISLYLSGRPELANFFNIDGSLPNDPESYGDIRFKQHTLSIDDPQADLDYLSGLLTDSSERFDYAFVAVGCDSTNLAIAKTVAKLCRTSLSLEGKHMSTEELQGLLPVYVSEDISKYPFFDELERMAFNVHLIWLKDLNIDFGDVKKDFKKPYNHNSCVSFILSMKYKLYSIGIDIDSGTHAEIAGRYLYCINNNKAQKNALICFEHRRWVTEKICDGYRRITDLKECVTGRTRDKKKKLHICIARSTPKHTLGEGKWVCSGCVNKKKWDSANKEELAKLDDLDRMSVELHLVYMEQAEIERTADLLNGNITASISYNISQDAECVISFNELLTCMKDIWSKDSKQCKNYEGLRQVFVDKVKKSTIISERDRRFVIQQMESLNEKFYPIKASQEYRDYKNDDVALVKGIPFILTYSESFYMVIPYKTGSSTDVFNNLAAVTVINPSKLIYLAYCGTARMINEIKATIPYVTNYMNRKKIRASVEYIIGYDPTVKIGDSHETEKEFKRLSGNRIAKVRMVESRNSRDFVSDVKAYLLRRRRDKQNFHLEVNDTHLSVDMACAGIFNEFSSYRFYSSTMKFEVVNDCDVVKYIRAKPYITVTDMFALNMSTSSTSNKPEFYSDYNELWREYRNNTGAWKYLCGLCKAYSLRHDLIHEFSPDPVSVSTVAEYRYILPLGCKTSTERILKALISENIIDSESCIQSMTTASCLVVIKEKYNKRKEFDELFSRIDILLQTEFISCNVDTLHHEVKIEYNDLIVRDMDCHTLYDNGYELLDFFKAKHYLTNLSYDKTSGKVSFTYATPQIKDLLVTEGRLLEIYTYHKAKETGAFDDIRSGFEIDWENSLAKNEFDCVITKGFSALFIECKATKSLQTEFYNKIANHTKVLGINAKAVLVADTPDSREEGTLNHIQRDHGEQLGVITITDRKEIENIGNVLVKLLK